MNAYQVTVKRVGSQKQPDTFIGEGARSASLQFYMQELARKSDLEEITREAGVINESTQEFEAHARYEHYKSRKQPGQAERR